MHSARARLLPVVVAVSGCEHVAPQTPHAAHDHALEAHQHAGGHAAFSNAAEWSKVFDDPARDAWQHPDDVVRALALTEAMVVADIGAGTGYFTMRVARVLTAGTVIATDIEPDMVKHLQQRAQQEKLTNVVAVLATAGASGLAASSVDRVLVVDVWHHLGDRVAFARDLAVALKPGGKIVVVDFTLAASFGPPQHMRLAPEAIIAEFVAAGLVAKLSSITLPNQYIIEAHRPDAPRQ